MQNNTLSFVGQPADFLQNHPETDGGGTINQLADTVIKAYSGIGPAYLVNNLLSALSAVLPIISVFIGSAIIHEEYSARTAPVKAAYWGWQKVTVNKAIILLGILLVTILLALLLGAAVGWIGWYRVSSAAEAQQSLALPVEDYSVPLQLSTAFLLSGFYGCFAFLMTLISKKSLIGCFVPLLFLYFIEGRIPFDYLPSKLGGYLMQHAFVHFDFSFFSPTSNIPALNIPSRLIFLLIYNILLFGLCFIYSKRQVITQRQNNFEQSLIFIGSIRAAHTKRRGFLCTSVNNISRD